MVHHFKRALLATLLPAAILASGSQSAMAQDQGPQIPDRFTAKPRTPSEQTLSEDGTKTIVVTPEGEFPSVDPFANTPSNLLPTRFSNAVDSGGDPIPNTLPSTPEDPYNLHPDPVVTPIDKTSPTDDLERIISNLEAFTGAGVKNAVDQVSAEPREVPNAGELQNQIQDAIDILEGNELKGDLASRAYSGFALLHYDGPNKVKAVEPTLDENGNVVGGVVNVHQLWMRQSIESDTAWVDASAVQNVPWTVRYTVDVLNGGHEDFAPFAVYFDDPQDLNGNRRPNVGLDTSFFPMEDGQRYVFEISMAPARYWNLTYHWGWRVHPPRIQAIENAGKVVLGKNIVQWEIDVFGENPRGSRRAQLEAIDMIGDIAPAKRMWTAFRTLQRMSLNSEAAAEAVTEARHAFLQWKDRTQLPDGVQVDPDSDITIAYMNNTIYGEMPDFVEDHQLEWFEWTTRPETLDVTVYNADYFAHTYVNVDFGGRLGWENTYHNTIPIGGQGPWFTFGRAHWMPNTAAPIPIPAAERPDGALNQVRLPQIPEGPVSAPEEVSEGVRPFRPSWLQDDGFAEEVAVTDGLGRHEVEITYNYEPSRRLRFYQFDPTHHNVAIFSIH